MSTPEALLEGRRSLDVSVRRLRFGSHAPEVPAAPVQHVLDRLVVNLLPAVDAFHEALEGEDLETIFNESSAVLRQVDDFLEIFFVEGAAEAVHSAPLYRMQVASRQIMLVQSIFRDYVLVSGNASAQTSMSETIANFEAVHRALREGGQGVAKLSLVRQDVVKQWDRISAVWGAFRQQLLVIPTLSDRATVLGSVQETLNSLVAELEVGVQLFGIQDEEMKGEYMWPIIAYSGFVVVMLGCICAAIYTVKRYYRERAEWSAHAHDKV